jgi:hypothetical protein
MPQDETNLERGASAAKASANHHDSAASRDEGMEPELQAPTSENVPRNVAPPGRHDSLISDNMGELKDVLKFQKWHRPYGEALLEADSAKRAALIAEAEQAIFTRCLELRDSPVPADESLDLQHAVDALSQLKKTDA